VTAFNLARSEAVKRSVRVTVCKSADGATCAAGGDYEQGWIVFNDPNSNAAVDPPNEQVIRAYGPLSEGLTLTGNGNVVNYVSFVPAGVSQLINGGFQNGTLTLCKAGYATSARQLVLGRGGRVRVERVEPAAAAGC
jgi:type IV fimbrial biogenesis protein FimT